MSAGLPPVSRKPFGKVLGKALATNVLWSSCHNWGKHLHQAPKKAPAPAIWIKQIAAPVVSSKVHETETELICNTHAIFTHVGASSSRPRDKCVTLPLPSTSLIPWAAQLPSEAIKSTKKPSYRDYRESGLRQFLYRQPVTNLTQKS